LPKIAATMAQRVSDVHPGGVSKTKVLKIIIFYTYFFGIMKLGDERAFCMLDNSDKIIFAIFNIFAVEYVIM
jgi:hypothetical protein